MNLRYPIARPAVFVSLLLACGGEDLVLPVEGEPAAIAVVQGDAQTGRVGEALAEPVVARVTDARGRPVSGVPVVLTLADGAGGEVTPADTRTGGDGTAAFQVVLGSRVGAVAGRVVVTTVQGTPTVEAPLGFTAVSADAAGLSLVSGDGQSAAAGSPLAEPLVVQVADAFGNPIPGVTVVWEAEGGGTVSGESVPTDAAGLAAVVRTLGPAAGAQQTRASAEGLVGSPVTFGHTATAGTAARLEAVSGDGQRAVVETPLDEELVVVLLDPAGNPVAGTPVTWVVGQGGGTLAPETGPTDEAGRAATRWTLGPTPGSQTVTAVVSGVGVVTFNATGIPGTPPGLRLATQPAATARRGVVLTRQPVVQLVDPAGADLRQAAVPVTVAVAAGGGRILGTLTRVTDAEGRAAFSGLALEGPAGRYTLAFGAAGFSAAISSPIELARSLTTTTIGGDDPDPSSPGAAVRVVFTVVSPGGRPTGNVTVRAEDGASCSASVSAGACSLTPTTAGSQQLTATYEGNLEFEPSSDTESHTVNLPPPAGPSASASTVALEPATVEVGDAAAIRVTVRDAAGVPLPEVDVTVAVSGSGNSISPATDRTNGGGEARFAVTSTVAEAKTVTVQAGGVTLDSRPVLTVTRAATTTRIESDSPDPSDAGQPVEVRVSVRSEGGTPGGSVSVAGDGGISCTASLSGGAGSCTLTPGTAGRITLTAEYAGDAAFLPSAATESHDVRAPAVRVLAMRAQPSDEAVPGQPFDRQPEVQLALETGGTVSEAGVTVRASIASGAGTLQGTTQVQTDGEGRARFTDLAIAGTEGTYTLSFGADGFRAVTSDPVELRLVATETEITRDDPDPSEPGEPVEVSVRVRARGEEPTGIVTVSAGPGGASCSAALERGEGRCTLVLTQEGGVTLTATYPGGNGFAPSSGQEDHGVEGANVPPGASDDEFSLLEGATLEVAPPGVLANDGDPDEDPLVAEQLSGAGEGSATLAPDGGLRYVPPPDFFGGTTFSYRSRDPEASSAPATVTLSVEPVNDAPSFQPGPDPVAGAGAGPEAIAGWAGSISPGPGEQAQSVAFDLTVTSGADLFDSPPAVAADGTLTFDPAAAGSATVEVRLVDDGGTANGGSDTSPPALVEFTITP